MESAPEKLRVTEAAASHLLDTGLCGLFESGVVRKHRALATCAYTVDPNIHPRIQRIIRKRIMPVVETWTHSGWREASEWSPSAFNWVVEIPAPDFHWVGAETGGLAYPGGDATLSNANLTTGLDIPEEIVCNNGLHESAHALFYAVHSERGLMCIEPSCFGRVLTVDSWDWRWRGPVTRAEHAAFAAYGHPMLADGMTVDEVASRLEIVEEKASSARAKILLAGFLALLALGVGWAVSPWESIAEAIESLSRLGGR